MKRKLGKTLCSVFLSLAMVVGLLPGMSLTAKADNTETLLTTITPTGRTTYSVTTAGVGTVSHDNDDYRDTWGWLWHEAAGTLTVSGCEGYTITKVIFEQYQSGSFTDSSAPFELHFDITSGTNIECLENNDMIGVSSIEVYGYASSEPSVAVTPEGAGTVTVVDHPTYNNSWQLTATPAAGYVFKEWTYTWTDYQGSQQSSTTDNPYSLNKSYYNEGRISDITAVFEVDAPSAAISPENSGTVSVTFDSASNNWIFTASPAEGYVFDEWNFIDDGYPNNDESNPLSVNRSTFRNWSNLTAVFEEAPAQTYTVTYCVVNGTWSDGTTADKTETVQSGSAPASVPSGMIAGAGFTGGSWNPDPSSATITGNITFTYTFEAESVDPDPVTPDPEPVTPSDTPAPVITPEQIQRMAVEHFVERLYVEALGRQFDKNGRDAWADILMAGGSASAVARGFFGSREFLNRDLTNEEFVTILYKVFYDSVPQTGSYTNWVDALYNDTMTRSELIDNFISSYEWASFCARYGVNV